MFGINSFRTKPFHLVKRSKIIGGLQMVCITTVVGRKEWNISVASKDPEVLSEFNNIHILRYNIFTA